MKRKMEISRRTFLNKCLSIGASGAVLSTMPVVMTSCKSQDRKVTAGKLRNVLLLISDDHGIDQLGCYGNRKIKTPHLDRMAEKGVRFTNAFAVCASCSASRGTILSGLFPHQNGQYGHQHNWHHFSYLNSVQSLPALLKENGYRTGLIGKLHVGPQEKFPFDFRVFSKEIMGNRDVMTMAEKAKEFFLSTGDKPFFLLVGYSDPHRSAKGWSKMTNVENFSGFGNDRDYPGCKPVKYNPDDVHVPDFLPDIPEVREELADQYQAITRLDEGVGKILQYLEESGKYDETLIIYISDNGIPFPGAKTTIYDSGVRLPMIVNSPLIAEGGKVNRTLISYTDFVPTILEWTETSGPGYDLPGKSFLPVLNQENSNDRDAVYQSHTFHEITMYYPMRAIRTELFHYIQNLFPELEFPFATDLFISKTWQGILKRSLTMMGKRKVKDYLKRPAEELYDIVNDPGETVNLAGDPAYKGVLAELRRRLMKMREVTKDPWLINDNYRINSTLY